jgi:H+/gluconate symporter-like permease
MVQLRGDVCFGEGFSWALGAPCLPPALVAAAVAAAAASSTHAAAITAGHHRRRRPSPCFFPRQKIVLS